jgi:hypothetical protein
LGEGPLNELGTGSGSKNAFQQGRMMTREESGGRSDQWPLARTGRKDRLKKRKKKNQTNKNKPHSLIIYLGSHWLLIPRQYEN